MRRVPGSHAPNSKNRSSKHLTWFTKVRSVFRSMNIETLRKLSGNGIVPATSELNRRDKIRDKNEVRKQRYLEKIAKKRNSSK